MWQQQNNTMSGGGGFSQFDAPGGFMSTQNAADNLRPKGLRPCSIQQLLNAEVVNDKFTINGIELNLIAIAARIASSNIAGTRVDFTLVDDNSQCSIDVRQFTDAESPDELDAIADKYSFSDNAVVKVSGHLRKFQESRNIIALKITQLHSTEELECFEAEIEDVTADFQLEQLKPQLGDDGLPQGGHGQGSAVNGFGAGGSGGGNTSVNNSGDISQDLLDFIKRYNDDDAGVHVSVICQALSGYSEAQIRKELNTLSCSGAVYNSLSDEDWKST